MKLSEISTDKALDVLCKITPYVNNILTDEELLTEFKNIDGAENVETYADKIAFGANKINKIVPIIFKHRKQDIYGILAVLNEKTIEEISKQNFLITAKQIKKTIKDKELIDFFKSCTDMEGGE